MIHARRVPARALGGHPRFQRALERLGVCTQAGLMNDSLTLDELNARLDAFEQDLRQAGLSEKTVFTYVDRSRRFLRYLAGEYRPGG